MDLGNSNIIIKVNNVSFSYENDTLFNDINFCIYENEFLGLIGPNGGGKTTIAKLLLGLISPDSGEIVFNQDLHIRDSGKIGYVPQNVNLNMNFPILAIEVVEMGLLRKTLFGFRSNKQIRERSMSVLKELKISDIAYRKIGELSGGQRQKVLIARAMVSRPFVLILDEPTSNVDMQSQNDIYSILKKLSANHTIIMISHDITMMLKYATRILHINRDVISHNIPKIDISDKSHIL